MLEKERRRIAVKIITTLGVSVQLEGKVNALIDSYSVAW